MQNNSSVCNPKSTIRNFFSLQSPIYIIITLLLVALWRPLPAAAWSRKGHVLITRAAVKLLLDDPKTPAPLQALLREGLGNPAKTSDLEAFVIGLEDSDNFNHGLDLFCFRPDELVAAHSPVPAFGSTEELMHYLNTEEFQSDPSRRKFSPDGANKVRPSDLPRDLNDPRYQKAGFVTFRAEQCYQSLVESLAKNYSDEQIFLWIGYLSHYIGDAYQPYHSTIDYQGFGCPCNQGREPKHDFHPDMEGTLFQDKRPAGQELRARFWKYFQEGLAGQSGPAEAQSRLDPYLIAQNGLLSGYDYLPMLCRAGAAALARREFDPDAWFNYREAVGQREMSVLQVKAERMAQATLALRALILQAWREAEGKKRG